MKSHIFLVVLQALQWFLGVSFIITALGSFGQSAVFALSLLLFGFWVIPQARTFVLGKIPTVHQKQAKLLIPFGLVFLVLMYTPDQVPTEPTSNTPEPTSEVVEESPEPEEVSEVDEAEVVKEQLTESESTEAEVPQTPEELVEEVESEPESLPMVMQVIDGDTFVIEGDETVRLIGINAPERNQPFYDEATSYLRDLVEDREVRLESDVNERDRFGRLLAYVYVGETFVNETMVAQGLAKSYAYEPDTAKQDVLNAAQGRAQANGNGMWFQPEPTLESSEASTNPSFAVVEFQYNSPGNDNETMTEEYVVLKNTSSANINMNGYTVSDEANHAYTFGNFTLDAGASVTLRTGSGTDSNSNLYWNNNAALWNNGGDTLYLANSAGEIVFTYSY